MSVGAALKPPMVKSVLAQRILSEEQVIRLMYHCGLRVSEVCELTWGDCIERQEVGQLNIWGKGDKIRQVLVSQSMWDELMSLLPEEHDPHSPVFQSRTGQGELDSRQIERIVSEAAQRAGIKGNASPHWLRHAHASHSLDRGLLTSAKGSQV